MASSPIRKRDGSREGRTSDEHKEPKDRRRSYDNTPLRNRSRDRQVYQDRRQSRDRESRLSRDREVSTRDRRLSIPSRGTPDMHDKRSSRRLSSPRRSASPRSRASSRGRPLSQDHYSPPRPSNVALSRDRYDHFEPRSRERDDLSNNDRPSRDRNSGPSRTAKRPPSRDRNIERPQTEKRPLSRDRDIDRPREPRHPPRNEDSTHRMPSEKQQDVNKDRYVGWSRIEKQSLSRGHTIDRPASRERDRSRDERRLSTRDLDAKADLRELISRKRRASEEVEASRSSSKLQTDQTCVEDVPGRKHHNEVDTDSPSKRFKAENGDAIRKSGTQMLSEAKPTKAGTEEAAACETPKIRDSSPEEGEISEEGDVVAEEDKPTKRPYAERDNGRAKVEESKRLSKSKEPSEDGEIVAHDSKVSTTPKQGTNDKVKRAGEHSTSGKGPAITPKDAKKEAVRVRDGRQSDNRTPDDVARGRLSPRGRQVTDGTPTREREEWRVRRGSVSEGAVDHSSQDLTRNGDEPDSNPRDGHDAKAKGGKSQASSVASHPSPPGDSWTATLDNKAALDEIYTMPPIPHLTMTNGHHSLNTIMSSFKGAGSIEAYSTESNSKIGEGTFGVVTIGIHKPTNRKVALKKLVLQANQQGLPVTSVREIAALKALDHPNVIKLLDIAVEKKPTDRANYTIPTFYMAFPYMTHDLAGLLQNAQVTLTPAQIKSYMHQLLNGVAYIHKKGIIHRDMKTANILIDDGGNLKIADLGLARAINKEFPMTPGSKVVTLWYRPPELLLDDSKDPVMYDTKVDMWGVGCIFVEMWDRCAPFRGATVMEIVSLVWKLCGSPSEEWIRRLPENPPIDMTVRCERRIRERFERQLDYYTIQLIDQLLVIDPKKRLTAKEALEQTYFKVEPVMAVPNTPDFTPLPTSHEFLVQQRNRARETQASYIPGGRVPIQRPVRHSDVLWDERNQNMIRRKLVKGMQRSRDGSRGPNAAQPSSLKRSWDNSRDTHARSSYTRDSYSRDADRPPKRERRELISYE